jgi:glutathione S-transferase
MSQFILHHFDISPFAEKARKVFGLKSIEWQSVQIPMIMPKPALMPLTGGYRKTPVLQIGADIFCDSRRILREIDLRVPKPTLFPSGNEGLVWALSEWSDKAFFESGAALSMGVNADIPEDVLKDRMTFFNFMDFDRLDQDIPHLYAQLRGHADLVDRQLADGRRFVLGEDPGLADINAWFVIWMVRANVPPVEDMFAPFRCMHAWEERMREMGEGQRQELDPEAALDIARDAEPSHGEGIDPDDPLGLRAGERVAVTPDDYGKVPVAGQLVTLSLNEIAIRRTDPRVGEVTVHFPRIGYRVERA